MNHPKWLAFLPSNRYICRGLQRSPNVEAYALSIDYQSFFPLLSDPSAILKIEKAITSGTALVLYNIDGDIDSLFMPLIYHKTTSISEETEKGLT